MKPGDRVRAQRNGEEQPLYEGILITTDAGPRAPFGVIVTTPAGNMGYPFMAFCEDEVEVVERAVYMTNPRVDLLSIAFRAMRNTGVATNDEVDLMTAMLAEARDSVFS